MSRFIRPRVRHCSKSCLISFFIHESRLSSLEPWIDRYWQSELVSEMIEIECRCGEFGDDTREEWDLILFEFKFELCIFVLI